MCNGLFDYPLGCYGQDFIDAEGVLSLLNSDRVVDYYKRFCSYPSNKCQNCKWYAYCGGGCPIQWSVFSPDDYVKSKQTKWKEVRKGG